MFKVGITGGMGSGKSVVSQVFEVLGIPVFNADNAARYLMEHDSALVAAITRLLGAEVYNNGKLEKGKISTIIFNNPAKLATFNALVHPATIRYGQEWMESRTTPYILKEAAILFESGSHKDLDMVIGVSAPLEIRITRVMHRSNFTREKVLSIIANQMDDTEKMALCDVVIMNDDTTAVLPQVLAANATILAKKGR